MLKVLKRSVEDWCDFGENGDLCRLYVIECEIAFPVRALFDIVHAVNSRPFAEASAGCLFGMEVKISRVAVTADLADVEGEERIDAIMTANRAEQWRATIVLLERSRPWQEEYVGEEHGRASRLTLPFMPAMDFATYFGAEELPEPSA